MGNYRHHFRRVLPYIGFALVGAFLANGSMAADPVRVAVEVTFVETIEVAVADPGRSGTADQNLAITSSPGRVYTILADSASDDITISYQ